MLGTLLCIGHELIYGRILNENAKFAGETLRAYGFQLAEVVVVPDEVNLIVKALKRLSEEHDFLIVSGGLGPTDDDLTVFAVSQAFSLELEESKEILSALEKNLEYSKSFELARRLSVLPKGSKPLAKDFSKAGFRLTYQGKPLFFLPGVPSQFRELLIEVVIPYLLQMGAKKVAEKTSIVRFFDLNETDLNLFLQEYLRESSKDEIEVGYYPEVPEVKLVLHGSEAKVEGLKEALKQRFRFQWISEDDRTLPEVVGEILTSRGLRLAVAESCTGGLLSSFITAVSGSSNYFYQGFVVYSVASKIKTLGVSPETVEKYSVYSHEAALEMALRTLQKSAVDLSLAITGIAGPTGGTKELPVGSVFVALCTRDFGVSVKFYFPGRRVSVQRLASYTALDMTRRYLLYGEGLSRYRFALEFKERHL